MQPAQPAQPAATGGRHAGGASAQAARAAVPSRRGDRLQGSYLDMVSYMEALEQLPVQLFWGKAKLDAQQYPNSRLTLTLYTLSLDPKWMKL
jgi:MSHA biogenesis protein MshJ